MKILPQKDKLRWEIIYSVRIPVWAKVYSTIWYDPPYSHCKEVKFSLGKNTFV